MSLQNPVCVYVWQLFIHYEKEACVTLGQQLSHSHLNSD